MSFNNQENPPAIAVIGGSGLYAMDGLEDVEEIVVKTPFGDPSDTLVKGRVEGRDVYFLPRHGRGHRLLPHELPHQANIWALRSMNVRWVICVTAVGSLREEYAPRSIVLPNQYFDRTSRREHHTFFGKGIVGHISFGDPVSENLRRILRDEAIAEGATVHDGGTYVCMDGPAFSTKAESERNRRDGFDVIGMTNLPEAKLAREAEMSLATLAMVTDYDCWKEDEDHVSANSVISHLTANAGMAKTIVRRAISRIPAEPTWPEHKALDPAVMTPMALWPAKTASALGPILARWIRDNG